MSDAGLGAGYRSDRGEVPLVRELVLAIGIPLVLLLLAVLAVLAVLALEQ